MSKKARKTINKCLQECQSLQLWWFPFQSQRWKRGKCKETHKSTRVPDARRHTFSKLSFAHDDDSNTRLFGLVWTKVIYRIRGIWDQPRIIPSSFYDSSRHKTTEPQSRTFCFGVHSEQREAIITFGPHVSSCLNVPFSYLDKNIQYVSVCMSDRGEIAQNSPIRWLFSPTEALFLGASPRGTIRVIAQ